MTTYDPERAPNPAKWLALDEQERMLSVEQHHARERIELEEPLLHALLHAVVENQIALGIKPVKQTLARLIAEGLTRHDAIQAMGAVFAEHMLELMKPDADSEGAQSRIEAALLRIDVRAFLASGGNDQSG